MERRSPPIRPYRKSPRAEPKPQIPLLFKDSSPLEPYLPPPRSNYLTENGAAEYNKSKDLGKINNPILPHVTLTYAQSLDAQISLQPGTQTILSGPQSKAMTHYLRSRHDAIMVGVGTAKADNPGLSTRYSEDGKEVVGLHKQPRPFVLDPGGKWKVEDTPKLFQLAEEGAGRAPWWVVGWDEQAAGDVLDEDLKERIEGVGGSVIELGRYQGREEGVDWQEVLSGMAATGVGSVMIEGGGVVIKDLLKAKNQKYISSIIVTIAPTYLGAGGVGIAPHRSVDDQNEVHLKDLKWVPLGSDIVMAGRIKHD